MSADSRQIQAAMEAAFQCFQSGDLAGAAEIYRHILRVDASCAPALHQLGIVHDRAGQPEEAIKLLRKAARISPHVAHIQINLGQVLLKQGQLLPAIDHLRHGVSLDTKNGDGWMSLGLALAEAGAYAPAVEAFRQFDRSRPDDAVAGELLDAARSALDYTEAPQATAASNDTVYLGSVVVPIYNAAPYLERALHSIAEAVLYLQANRDPGARIKIVLVDDASTDTSVAVASAWIADRPDTVLLRQPSNRGAGPARNRGADAGEGRYLWFLDADDWYTPNHLATMLALFDEKPDAGYVRTRLDTSVAIHPGWMGQLSVSQVGCIGVRREAHVFVRGFPEQDQFRQAKGGEDVAYSMCLERAFRSHATVARTLFYGHRPGNALDHQLARFQHAPGEGPADSELLPDWHHALIPTIQHLISTRMMTLRFRPGRPPDLPPPAGPETDVSADRHDD